MPPESTRDPAQDRLLLLCSVLSVTVGVLISVYLRTRTAAQAAHG